MNVKNIPKHPENFGEFLKFLCPRIILIVSPNNNINIPSIPFQIAQKTGFTR